MPRPARDRPARELSPDRLTLLLGCGLSVVLSVWFTWGIWATGVPVGDDTAAHYVRTQYAIDNLFANGLLDGWQSSFGLGYQEFLFVGPGFTVVAALLKVLSLGGLSTVDAFKLTVVLSFVALPLAMAVLAWAFGLGLRAAGVVAPLTWIVSSTFGGAGLKGVFEGGLLPNQLASTFLVLTLAGIVLLVRRPSPRRVVFTAAMGALTLFTHPIAAYILAFLAACLVVGVTLEWFRAHGPALRAVLPILAREDEADTTPAELAEHLAPVRALLAAPARRVVGLVAAGALALGLAAAMIVPLLAHPELRGENSDWGDAELVKSLQAIWRGDAVLRPYVAVAVVAGWLFVLWQARQRRPLALTLALTPVLYLLLGRVMITTRPDNIVAIQMTNRGFGYVALLLVLPVAALIAAPVRPVTSLLHVAGFTAERSPVLLVCNAVLPLVVVGALVVLPPKLGREIVGPVTPTATVAGLATAISELVPPGERFVTQRAPARERELTGMSHPDLWLVAATGRDTLNIFNLTSSTVFGPVYEGENLTSRPPDREADELARLGVSHVALIDTALAPDLLTSPRFHTVWRVGTMALLEVLPASGQPAPASFVSATTPVTASTERDGPGRYTFTVESPVPTTVTLAVAWSTKWSISVDGVPVAPTATADKLLQVAVPAGSSVITLAYGPDRADAIGRTISLACVVLAATVLVLDRRRRRSGTPADAATAVATATTATDRPEATASPGGPGGPGDASTASMATVAAVLTERVAGPEDREPDRSERERDPGDVLTLAEAAALLRVSTSALERQLHQGTIPGRRIGEDWRLSRAAVLTWLAAALDDPALPAPATLFATTTTDPTTDRETDPGPGEPPQPHAGTDPERRADRGTGPGRTDPER